MGHGCCGPGYCGPGYGRKYPTKEEKIKKLEQYKETLETEAKGVEERLKELTEEA